MSTPIDRLADQLEQESDAVVSGFATLLRTAQPSMEELELRFPGSVDPAGEWVSNLLVHYIFGWYDAIDLSLSGGAVYDLVRRIQRATKVVQDVLAALGGGSTAKAGTTVSD